MKPSRIFVLTALAFAALPATAGQSNAESTATKADEVDPNIAETVRRGKMLYDFDQAAWHSTDALAAKAGDVAKLKLAGRVVVPVETGLQTTYYGRNDAGRYAIFTGLWNGKKIVDPVYSKGETGPALSADANAYADIIELLMAGELETKDLWFCNKAQPNFVLLPGAASGEFFLYFMTAQERITAYPIGGHHRYDIRDGKVVSHRSFANSCIAFDKKDQPKDAVSAGFVVSHLLDPIPTEIHVFTALASKTDLFVATTQNSKTWMIATASETPTIEPIGGENWK